VSKNITRKELKHPDQFVSFWTRFSLDAQRALASRKQAVAIGLGALALVGAALIVISQVRTRNAERDSRALARVDKIATADLLPAEGATNPDLASDGLPHFKTEKERLEAALKELDGFLTAHSGSRLRPEALVHKGAYLLDLQRADDAIAVYTKLLSDGDLEGRLRYLVLEGLGYGYEAKGDLDRAASTFARLGDEAGKDRDKDRGKPAVAGTATGFYQDRALYHKARIADVKGDRAEAVRLYREVLEKAPTTSLRDDISNRLAVLEPK
jgi:tetratricopeptide (TPR) repeat protein